MTRAFHRLREFLIPAYESLLIPPEAVQTPFWQKFDHLIGGLRPYEYSILCGSTGSGKSAWLASLVERVATFGSAVFVASVENGPVDFDRRMISARVGENWNEGQTIAVEKVERFQRDNPKFVELPVFVATYEDRVDNDELIEQVRIAVVEENVKLAVLDNLNFFMEVKRAADQIVEMDRVVHDWIIFAKSHPVHVIMVMHPRKTDGGRVLSEFDIKGSSTAVQEAHNVWLFNRLPEKTLEEQEHLANYRDFLIRKCRRRGRSVGRSIMFYSKDGGSYEERDPFQSSQGDSVPGRKHDDRRYPDAFL